MGSRLSDRRAGMPNYCKTPGCNVFASKKYDGLCIHCARKAGLAEGFTKETREKMANSAKERHARERKEQIENISTPQKQNPTKILSDDVYFSLHQKNFNLKERVDYYVEVDSGNTYGNFPKLVAYVEWFYADINTRKPKDRKNAAEIMDVSEQTLRGWERSAFFKRCRSNMLDEIVTHGFGKEVRIATALELANSGEQKGVELLQKEAKLGEERDASGSKQVLDFINEEKFKEAMEIVGDKVSDRGIAKKLSDEAAQNKYLKDGLESKWN